MVKAKCICGKGEEAGRMFRFPDLCKQLGHTGQFGHAACLTTASHKRRDAMIRRGEPVERRLWRGHQV